MSVSDYPKEVLDALERDHGIRFKGQHSGGGDARLCYGATCTWFGSIHETKQTRDGLPVCPSCGGVLFEMPHEGEWWKGIDEYEMGIHPSAPGQPHPGYRAMWEWQRGQKKCFSIRDGIGPLEAAYAASQAKPGAEPK
jgi:hypothetical protein